MEHPQAEAPVHVQKVALITGGSDGLGKLAALKYLRAGWRVIITGRSVDKLAAAVAEAKKESPEYAISSIIMDLGSLDSIRAAAEQFIALNLPLNLLINNAGGILPSRQVDPSGIFEMTIFTNFVGPFYLTELLTPKLVSTTESRVLIVSSSTHNPEKGGPGKPAHLDLENLDGHKEWDDFFFYKVSKLCNIYHTYLLAPQLQKLGVTVNCFCPGFVPNTSLVRNASFLFRTLMKRVLPLMPSTTTADTSTNFYLYYGTSEELVGVTGSHFSNGKIEPSSAESHDLEKGKVVWNLACDVTGLKERKL